jgi:hypothetical protein
VPTDPPTTAQGLDEFEAAGEKPAASRFTAVLRSRNPRVTGCVTMKEMRKLLVLAVAVSLVFAAGAAAARGGKAQAGQPPQFPNLPGNWTHVEINLKIKRVPHTLILDRGRITQVSPVQVTLREADGSTVTVPLAPSTLVNVRGRGRRTILALRRAQLVETMRIDGGTAVRVLVLPRR